MKLVDGVSKNRANETEGGEVGGGGGGKKRRLAFFEHNSWTNIFLKDTSGYYSNMTKKTMKLFFFLCVCVCVFRDY